MSCFMGYNPLVAKEVKITTWIKEFDGDSPVYPSFPNDGDCFVVFATDEDALTHNALSKKTYTNGEWADAEGGGGSGGDYKVFKVTVIPQTADDSFGLQILSNTSYAYGDSYDGLFMVAEGFTLDAYAIAEETVYDLICYGDSVAYVFPVNTATATSGAIEYDEENSCYIISGDCSVTGYNND